MVPYYPNQVRVTKLWMMMVVVVAVLLMAVTPVTGQTSPADLEMTLNASLSVPLSPDQVVTYAAYLAGAQLGLFFTSGLLQASRYYVHEVYLPAEGPMVFVGSRLMPEAVDTALVAPSSSSSPSSFDVYVGANSVLTKLTITPAAQPTNPSTFASTSITFSGVIDSMVLANQYIYFSGRLGQSSISFIQRVPLNNFTTSYVSEHDPILVTEENYLQAASYDGLYVYFGSANNPRAYRVDTTSFTVDRNITLQGSGLRGSFVDIASGLLYFITANSLIKVNTSSFEQVQAPIDFEQSAVYNKAILHDVYGGHAYFGHSVNPGVISHVNLQAYTLQPTFYLESSALQIDAGVLDAPNNFAYFATTLNSSVTILKIQLPLPCAGLGSFVANTTSDNCSFPRGYCEYATCHCLPTSGYEGPSCTDLRCLNDCYRDAANNPDELPHGTCLDGECSCTVNYTGADCGTRQCTNDCTGRGNCTGEPDYRCQCPLDWTGDDCSIFIPVPSCDRLYTCGECGRNQSCGWCESSNECLEGDSFGPMTHLCERYSYSTCPSLFYFSFGYVLTVICWLFMLGSAALTVWQDYTLPENTKARRFVQQFWWRNQLAAKTWQLVEYIQLLAVTGYLSVDLPPSYLEFILPFQWSILHLPYPFSDASVIRPPTLQDNNSFFVQGRVVESAAHEIFLGNLFFYAIVIAAAFVLFVFPVIIVAACANDSRVKDRLTNMSKSRLLYILIRLNQFAYLPLTATSFFTIIWYSRADSHPGSFTAAIALSVIVLVIVGLALPLITFLKIFNKDKELFAVAFSMKYGSLYQKYHFRKVFFTTIQFAKLLVIAIWIGLLYNHPIPQLLMLAFTHVVYFIIVMIGRPHADHIHFFTELVVTLLQVILFLFFLGFRTSDAGGWAIGVVVVHILAISVIVVGICSTLFQMNGITGVSDLKDAVSAKDKDTAPEDMTGLQKEHRVSSSASVNSM